MLSRCAARDRSGGRDEPCVAARAQACLQLLPYPTYCENIYALPHTTFAGLRFIVEDAILKAARDSGARRSGDPPLFLL